MILTEELILKHRAVLEAQGIVKAHTAHSKTGKTFTVKQHTRNYDAALATLSKSGANRVRSLINRGAPDSRIKAAIRFQREMDAKGAAHIAGKKARLAVLRKKEYKERPDIKRARLSREAGIKHRVDYGS